MAALRPRQGRLLAAMCLARFSYALWLRQRDHPLVERPGYQVFFLVPENPSRDRRSRMVKDDGSAMSGGDLLETLAHLLTRDRGREETVGE